MKRAGYIITLMIAFWMVAGGLFFAQSVQAKVVSGSCGGETKYRYDSQRSWNFMDGELCRKPFV